MAIWRVLRRLWSRISGTSGTGGEPCRLKTRWPSSVKTYSPPSSGSFSAASSGSHQASAKSCASSTTMASNRWPGLEFGCEVGHLQRQVVLPELDGLLGAQRFVGPCGRTPLHAEGVELADVGGLLAARPGGGDALQVGRQAVRVADQGDALASLGEPAGLLHGQEGLAAAGAAADLDAVEQPDGVEDDGLVFGERVGGVLVGQSAGDDVALRQSPAAERGGELVDALAG